MICTETDGLPVHGQFVLGKKSSCEEPEYGLNDRHPARTFQAAEKSKRHSCSVMGVTARLDTQRRPHWINSKRRFGRTKSMVVVNSPPESRVSSLYGVLFFDG